MLSQTSCGVRLLSFDLVLPVLFLRTTTACPTITLLLLQLREPTLSNLAS